MKYKLNIDQDVDVDGHGEDRVFILNLPYGFCFEPHPVDATHVRGYDTMSELKKGVKTDVYECECVECERHKLKVY
jgi:hypothetical protein